MPPIELLLPFFAATLAFAIMPGPAILYTAAQTIARGRKGGFFAVFGIHVGGFIHVAAAAAGLSAIFTHVPEAYAVLKIVGAIYLVWLGIQILRSHAGGSLPGVQGKGPQRAFMDSVLVEVLNPKTALFFIAFLPQFVDPSAAWPLWLQFVVLGTIVNVAFSLADVVTVLITTRMVRLVTQNSLGERLARWFSGSILVGLGVHLAVSRD